MPSLNHKGIISPGQCIDQQEAEVMLKGLGSSMFIENQYIPLKGHEKLHYVNSVNVRLHTANHSFNNWHSILGHPDPKAVTLTEGLLLVCTLPVRKRQPNALYAFVERQLSDCQRPRTTVRHSPLNGFILTSQAPEMWSQPLATITF